MQVTNEERSVRIDSIKERVNQVRALLHSIKNDVDELTEIDQSALAEIDLRDVDGEAKLMNRVSALEEVAHEAESFLFADVLNWLDAAR